MPAAPSGVVRVAIYTRKSTTAGLERDFNSLAAQREACEHYVRSRAHASWQIVPERYDDGGFTGANLERPAFRRLMEEVEARRVDVVVVYKVDRLSRSLLDFAKVMERFSKAGCDFVSVTQNFNTADAMGRLTLNMLMSFAEFEREMIAERMRDKIHAARRRGKWTGGPVPLGYELRGRKLVVNEAEAAIVREIHLAYLETRSLLAIVKELNERSITTKLHRGPSGHTFGGRTWTNVDVLRVLRNPLYGGFVTCGDELHPGEHPPIVEREVLVEVASALPKRSKTILPRNPAYTLRGLLFCGRCGAALTPTSQTDRRYGRCYRYYHCISRRLRGALACPRSPVSAPAIEEYVLEQLKAASWDGALIAETAARARAEAEHSRRSLSAERQALPAEIDALRLDASRLAEVIAKTKGEGARVFEPTVQEVGTRLARAEARLAEVERALATLEVAEKEAGWVARTLGDLPKVWPELTMENRGRLLRAVLERVEIDERGKVAVTLARVKPASGTDGKATSTSAEAAHA